MRRSAYAEFDANQAAIVRRRFDFDGWCGRNSLGGQLISYNTNPAVRLPGHEETRVRTSVASTAAPVAAAADGVMRDLAGREVVAAPSPDVPSQRSAQVVWWSESRPSVIVRAELFQHDSQMDAHEFLLRLLGEFQSPFVERKDVVFDDVAFGGRSDGLLLFARTNLVYLVRNVGWQPESVFTVALSLDADAISQPEPEDAAPAWREASAPGLANAQEADQQVEIVVADLADVPPITSIKVFARSGDLHVDAGRIMFRGPDSAARALRVRRSS
jgi:hypothetical protein